MLSADTKQYLYIDPGRVLSEATKLWDPKVGMGTVTHENIGYLWPMGPWYRLFAALDVPVWIAQRLWLGTLLFLAGLGVRWLLRTFGWRGPGVAVASLAYMLSPYLLQYLARISAILMAWTALPWLLGLAVLALRRGGWRYPALFAVVSATAGSVNATCLIYAGLAPVLWFPFAVWGLGEANLRRAIVTMAKIGGLSLLAASWWIAGLWTQSRYGLNVLRYTETVETVARTGLPFETLRGLGNWFFYGRDGIGPWIQAASDYTQWGWLLAVSFLVPALAFFASMMIRWRYKLYFVALMLVGVALSVGVHPYSHPSPLGGLLKRFATGSTLGLALRSTGRAVPLIAIGTAVLLGAGVDALWRRQGDVEVEEDGSQRRTVLASVATVAVFGLLAADMAPLWLGHTIDNNLQRSDHIPSYWQQAANYLSNQGRAGRLPGGPASGYATRALILPGADFAHYRWGTTLDPVVAALTNRPLVWREVAPYGTEGSVDLLRALDRRLQEGVLDLNALSPIAHKMGVGNVLLQSDLQYERFRTPRPRATWQLLNPPPPGLTEPVTFGPLIAETPVIPYTDEVTLGTPPNALNPPAVAVFGISNPTPIVRTEAASNPLILAGDGEGMVDAAAAGLLKADQPVFYAGDLDTQSGAWQQALGQGADLILSDENRLRAQRWGSLRENYGYVEKPGGQPLVTDTNNAPLPLFPGAAKDAFTVVQDSSGLIVQASNYGNTVSYAPSERPDLAADGSIKSAWKVGAFAAVDGERLRITLPTDVTTDQLTLVQPTRAAVPPVPGQPPDPDAYQLFPGERYITKITLTFDGKRSDTMTLDKRSLRPASGQRVTFPKQTFRSIEIRIDDTSSHDLNRRFDNGVGFADIRIGAPGQLHLSPVDEVLRLPTDLLNHAGTASLQHRLFVVLTRDRANPAEPFKADTEPSLARAFTLPTVRSFTIGGVARVSALAPDQEVDRWLGRPDPPPTNSSGRLPGDLNARSAMALDGNAGTWWSSAIGPQTGQWISVNLQHPLQLSRWAMQVVADGQHSVPTQMRVQVDDSPNTVLINLPPVTDGRRPGSIVSVPISLGQTLTAHSRVTFTITAVRANQSLDPLSNKRVDLPVGIAELGVPDQVVPPAGTSVPAGCNTKLMTIDGNPIGLRVLGSTVKAAERQGLAIQACGNGVDPTGAIRLGPGSHVIRTTPGGSTGIDIDQLLLGSEKGGQALPAAAMAPAPAARPAGPARPPQVTLLAQNSTSAKVQVAASQSGGPWWLVLGQSLNKGWSARIEGKGGRSLGAPKRVDGYANGWLIRPGPGQVLTISLDWTPQHRVTEALWVSALLALVCIALALASPQPVGRDLTTGTARLPDRPTAYRPWRSLDPALGGRRSLLICLGAGIIGTLLITPVAGIVVVAIVAAGLSWSRLQALPAAVALAGVVISGGYATESQVHHHFPLVLEWPQHFEAAFGLAWVAMIVLVADAVIRHVQNRHLRR